MEKYHRRLRRMMCLPILLYQFCVRPVLKPCCRFYPSCSEYALSAIQNFGVFKGCFLILKRILKCHPWSAGGYDPVLPNEREF